MLIWLALGSEMLPVFTFSAFSDAVKEALWHVDAGEVIADDLSPREVQVRTGTSWPCQV